MSGARAKLAALARGLIAPTKPTAAPPRGWRELGWRDYLLQRGWLTPDFARADTAAQHAAVSLLPMALTFPLTLAHHWHRLGLAGADGAPARICVIGARAEAALPLHIWDEAGVLLGDTQLEIEFSGPAAAPEGVAREQRSGRVLLRAPGEATLFHRTVLGRALLRSADDGAGSGAAERAPFDGGPALPDAFVCFNPGLGMPKWEQAWAPTLRAIEAANRPVLLTALSAQDAARDDAFLQASSAFHPMQGALVEAAVAAPYEHNPWGHPGLEPEEGEAQLFDGGSNQCVRVIPAR